MAANSNIESLCAFLEHFKQQQEEAKQDLHRKVDCAVDSLFGKLLTGLMIWASTNVNSNTFTSLNTLVNEHLAFSTTNDVPAQVPAIASNVDSIAPLNVPPKNSSTRDLENSTETLIIKEEQEEEPERIVNRCGSQEILDESYFLGGYCSDEDCDCPDCTGVDQIDVACQDNNNTPIISQISETTFGDSSSQSKQKDLPNEISDVFQNEDLESSQAMDNYELEDEDSDRQYAGPSRFETSLRDSLELRQQNQQLDEMNGNQLISNGNLNLHNTNGNLGFGKSNKFARIVSLKCLEPNCSSLLQSREEQTKHMLRSHRVKLHQCFQKDCNQSFKTK